MEFIARIHALTDTLDKITNLTSALVHLCVMGRELDAEWGAQRDLFKMGVTSSVYLFLGRLSRHKFCTRVDPAIASRVLAKCQHLLKTAALDKYRGIPQEMSWVFMRPPCGAGCVKTRIYRPMTSAKTARVFQKTRTAVLIKSARVHDVRDMGR